MAVPFRNVSKTRRDRRRANSYKVSASTITRCSSCGEMIKPHRVCPKCGYYKGEKKVIKEA